MLHHITMNRMQVVYEGGLLVGGVGQLVANPTKGGSVCCE